MWTIFSRYCWQAHVGGLYQRAGITLSQRCEDWAFVESCHDEYGIYGTDRIGWLSSSMCRTTTRRLFKVVDEDDDAPDIIVSMKSVNSTRNPFSVRSSAASSPVLKIPAISLTLEGKP